MPLVKSNVQQGNTISAEECNGKLKRHLEVPGSANGNPISAFPDTGVAQNLISERLASRCGLKVNRTAKMKFELPSRKIVKAIGTVELPWSFAGDSKVYKITCAVLTKCTHELILGSSFRHSWLNRIKAVFKPFAQLQGVRLVGSEQLRVEGELNSHTVNAVPDLGSDVNLLSERFARRCGLPIDRSLDRQAELEFVDGSRIVTNGVVDNISWRFGHHGESTKHKFFVLKDLPDDVEAVLGNDLLYETDAFRRYEPMFYQSINPDTTFFELGLIRNIGDLSPSLKALYTRFLRNSKLSSFLTQQTDWNPTAMLILTLADPSSNVPQHSMIDAEMNLRQEIRDAVELLAEADQPEAWRLEIERRKLFQTRWMHAIMMNQHAGNHAELTPARASDSQTNG